MNRHARFLDLSASITGFDRLHLLMTGVGPEYLQTLDDIVSAARVDELLQLHATVPRDDEAALGAVVFDHAVLGDVARGLVVLWYTGAWTPLSPSWSEAHGTSARNVPHVVSAAAYMAGLQWSAVGAHPAGALPPGFASWAMPPLGLTS